MTKKSSISVQGAAKGGEFETFKKVAGLNSFHLTPKKWIDATRAIGIQSRAGRYGGGTKRCADCCALTKVGVNERLKRMDAIWN